MGWGLGGLSTTHNPMGWVTKFVKPHGPPMGAKTHLGLLFIVKIGKNWPKI